MATSSVEDELLPHRLVEIEDGALLGDRFGGLLALGQEQARRVAGQDPEECEVERRHQDDGEDGVQHLAHEVSSFVHGSPGPPYAQPRTAAGPTSFLVPRLPDPIGGRRGVVASERRARGAAAAG